jgi:tetratricopeptide (TPR) repeat protein/tRNA A-37 threonylcarbamoyl transferase component Bud32
LAELTERLQAAVGDTYRIERELGGGGMSRVFLAEEPALGRRVVIKVLPPEMAAGVNRDRFQREIHLAARLQHPHIVQLLAAGSRDDLLWYVMPFIDGESLRVRLAKQSELPVKEVVRILREVTDALSYAHEQGVVHRDIKPDNVMLSGKHALVADFGVAKAVSESSSGGNNLTSLGLALGTPAYMAPEQASGDPNVDHRADLYALGAMAYEMLCGRPPFMGINPQAVLAAHVMQPPTTVVSQRPTVPPALNAIVMRCLEKRAADRWQSAEELQPHLEALLTPSGGTMSTTATAAISSGTETALARTNPMRVAALFAVGSLIALTVTWWLVQRTGLPDWVFLAAIGLLLAGLPIVLRAGSLERQRALARTTGLMPATPSGPLAKLSTLRGAVGGGVLAFVGLLVGAGAFMGLRAAGVGPFATLVTAGVLSSTDKLVLADFENRTSDSTLGQSVTEALRIDLTRSTVVRLVERTDLSAALRRMEMDPATPLDATVAQEVATRVGAKALIAGEIAPLGAGYVLSARIVGAADGRTLLAERESASDASQLITAVDKLSRKVREGIGESLKTIRVGEPLQEVTTSSLDALRKFSQAERMADQSRYAEAKTLLNDAIRLDSSFAMAWRKLGVVLGNTLEDPGRQFDAVQHAYDLRDRLPERERLQAVAFYHLNLDMDFGAGIQAYEELLQRWPDDIAALNNVAILYNVKRRYADAERVTRRGIEVSPQTSVLWTNLMDALGRQGHFAAADSAYRSFRELAPTAQNRFQLGYRLSWAKGDYTAAAAYADSAGSIDQPFFQAMSRNQRAALNRFRGHMKESRRLALEATEINVRRGNATAPFFMATQIASGVVLLEGRADEAVRILDSVVARYPLDSLEPASRPYMQLALAYSRAGAVSKAEALFREYERVFPEVLKRNDTERPEARGMLELASNRPAEAITSFRAYREAEGCTVCYMGEIGQAFDALNQPDSAIAAYEALATTPELGPAGRDFTMPRAYRRLGELYEGKGDVKKALEWYGKFVDLWKDADPEMQPKVTDVRKRIAELSARER